MIDRFRQLSPLVRWTTIYLVLWVIMLVEIRVTQWLPVGIHAFFCALSVPLAIVWLRRFSTGERIAPKTNGGPAFSKEVVAKWIVATVAYVLWWHLLMVLLDWIYLDAARASVARWGTVLLFGIGLLWVVWGIETASKHYRSIDPDRPSDSNWNPLDVRAWFYGVQWWPPRLGTMIRYVRRPRDPSVFSHGPRSRRLDQSLLALVGYSFAFLILSLLFAQLSGCREIYEMPAGGGEQKQLAQVVKIKKVIRKKFVVNPLSAVIFEVPPIDEVQLKLTEITEHAYTVGYGEGKGAGFSEGTFRGKVRFIRLEYSGGDWDQDFGVGGDLNMLLEYGIRTQHKVAERTESRTIAQLKNFPMGKSPPMVYMTGQQNISLSNSEVKVLREYLTDKHGMLFGDNGGSRHFHNQFIAMMSRVLPDVQAVPIPLDDVIHRIPYQIPYLPYVAPHGGKEALGWYKDGRWVAYYHPGDIGDAWADGHAGVNADIWESCYRIGTNVTFYAHSEYSRWLEARKRD